MALSETQQPNHPSETLLLLLLAAPILHSSLRLARNSESELEVVGEKRLLNNPLNAAQYA